MWKHCCTRLACFPHLGGSGEDIHEYQHAPLEFCEVASMSMELVGNEHLEEFYSSEDCVRARQQHLEGIISLFPWIATVDAFQHWIYTHPTHTLKSGMQLGTDSWIVLVAILIGAVTSWLAQNVASPKPHLFGAIYYIEYGIAQLGALGVWKNSKSDRAQALADYKRLWRLVALGHCRSYLPPQIFRSVLTQRHSSHWWN